MGQHFFGYEYSIENYGCIQMNDKVDTYQASGKSTELMQMPLKPKKIIRFSSRFLKQRTTGPVSLTWVHRICWTSLEIHDYMLYKLSPMQKH